jgi:hypothetical protein
MCSRLLYGFYGVQEIRSGIGCFEVVPRLIESLKEDKEDYE